AVEEEGAGGVPGIVPGDELLGEGQVVQIGAAGLALGEEVLQEIHRVKPNGGVGGDAVVQLVGVGVDELRGIPRLLQLPDGGGQLGINPLVQGGEGVPLPEEGAGQ